MKHLIAMTMAAIGSTMAMNAHAEMVEWTMVGEVSALATAQTTEGTGFGGTIDHYQVVGYTPVTAIRDMHTGQGFVADFVVDLSANRVMGATLHSTDGLLNYVDNHGNQPFSLNSNTPGELDGSFGLTDYGTAGEGPNLLLELVMQAHGSNVAGSSSLRDFSEALKSGAYSSITADTKLYCGFGPCQLGRATMNFTSISVVPEASTLPMFSMGVVGLMAAALRRDRARHPSSSPTAAP